jgi:hypothetical protein
MKESTLDDEEKDNAIHNVDHETVSNLLRTKYLPYLILG